MNITKEQIGAIFIAVLFGGSAIAYGISASFPADKDNQGPLARAFLEVRICGEEKQIPSGQVQTESGPLTVDENNTVSFPANSGITLGQVFDAINVTFSRTKLMHYENGNMCNTTYSNEVSVFKGKVTQGRDQRLRSVNQYRSYEVEHGDYIVVRYE